LLQENAVRRVTVLATPIMMVPVEACSVPAMEQL
jgi:hypothetical protein